MAYRIVASELFERSLARTIKWVKKEWSDQAAEIFNRKILTVIEKINRYPTIGKKSSRYDNVRSILVTRHNRLYYRVSDNDIILLELVETKQHPQKNKYE